MAKAAKKNQTSGNGSSARKGKNGNGGNGKAAAEKEKPSKPASNPVAAAEETTEAPAEKNRKGRAPTEGEPLKRVLIFLSESDVAVLKAEVAIGA